MHLHVSTKQVPCTYVCLGYGISAPTKCPDYRVHFSYECCKNNKFSRSHAPQSFNSFNPNNLLDMLILLEQNFLFSQDGELLPIIYEVLSYEMETHAKAMYLIVVMQMLKHSPFYSDQSRRIATEMYTNIHNLLQNARVISIQINFLYQDLSRSHELRTREMDNTTCLHLSYGFDNYDTFSLRLDLPHQNECNIHFNNLSPGGIKSYFYNSIEYQEIIAEHPEASSWFIELEGKWYLKERHKCGLGSSSKVLYQKLCDGKNHTPVFNTSYPEEDFLVYLCSVNQLVANVTNGSVDKDEENARRSYQLDHIMFDSYLYVLSFMLADLESCQVLFERIIDRAITYKLILNSDRKDYTSLEGLHLIIQAAKSRVKTTANEHIHRQSHGTYI